MRQELLDRIVASITKIHSPIQNGLQQGDDLSPLFNFALEYAIKKDQEESNLKRYIFWRITPRSTLQTNLRFGAACSLHL
jgi:hypothetical protein